MTGYQDSSPSNGGWATRLIGWIFSKMNVQSGSIITWSNITRQYAQHNSKWIRTYIRINSHKMHPIPRPHGRAMGRLLWGFGKKMTAPWQHRTVPTYAMPHTIYRWDSTRKTNFIANALELHLSCTNPWIYWNIQWDAVVKQSAFSEIFIIHV